MLRAYTGPCESKGAKEIAPSLCDASMAEEGLSHLAMAWHSDRGVTVQRFTK